MGLTLLRRSGIPGAWLRCSMTGASDGDCGDEASPGVGEEEVEAEAACMSLSAGIFELETLAMADRGLGLESGSERYGTTSHDNDDATLVRGNTQKRWTSPSLHEISLIFPSSVARVNNPVLRHIIGLIPGTTARPLWRTAETQIVNTRRQRPCRLMVVFVLYVGNICCSEKRWFERTTIPTMRLYTHNGNWFLQSIYLSPRRAPTYSREEYVHK